jgi:hypothetical protein
MSRLTVKAILGAIGDHELRLVKNWPSRRFFFWIGDEFEPVTERLGDLPLEEWIRIGKSFATKIRRRTGQNK